LIDVVYIKNQTFICKTCGEFIFKAHKDIYNKEDFLKRKVDQDENDTYMLICKKCYTILNTDNIKPLEN
jgi:hypothetical protein